MFLAGRIGGWLPQRALWQMVNSGDLAIADLDSVGAARAQALMEKYRDTPMALADATLVALAEARGLRRVFTLDSDFAVYRFRGRERFQVIP